MSRKSFGIFMKNLRTDLGMSQIDLAAAVNVHASYISHMENGRNIGCTPSEELLCEIADTLNYDRESFLIRAGSIDFKKLKAVAEDDPFKCGFLRDIQNDLISDAQWERIKWAIILQELIEHIS